MSKFLRKLLTAVFYGGLIAFPITGMIAVYFCSWLWMIVTIFVYSVCCILVNLLDNDGWDKNGNRPDPDPTPDPGFAKDLVDEVIRQNQK